LGVGGYLFFLAVGLWRRGVSPRVGAAAVGAFATLIVISPFLR
jgi:hypothetical protein